MEESAGNGVLSFPFAIVPAQKSNVSQQVDSLIKIDIFKMYVLNGFLSKENEDI